VDGLIFLTNHGDDGTLARRIDATPGIVLIDEDVAGTQVPKLFCDNEQGGRLAGAHLLEAGHRSLGFVGGPEALMSSGERLAGLRQAVAQLDGATLDWNCAGPHTPEQGRSAAEAWLALKQRPTGLFIGSGALLAGFLEGVRQAGLSVPADLSLVPLTMSDRCIFSTRRSPPSASRWRNSAARGWRCCAPACAAKPWRAAPPACRWSW
jgi:LacI family transcriptional regulator